MMSRKVSRYARDDRTRQREDNVQAVYDFIVAYLEEIHFPPSIQEIAQGTYMSRGNVIRYLDLLEARGYLAREFNIPRSIRLTDPAD